jgi:chitin disaccharide deacetylase
MPKIIINGDDFGLSAENNAGIVAAHRAGVVASTSLMMGGDAVQEAIELAQQHPKLAVGLHVSFSDTKPVLLPELVPLLVQPNGHFPPDDAAHRRALRSREGRRQLRAEITAQFRAFAATGLAWDHVNSHRHFHRFPPLAYLLFREAARWPVKATRIPYDPPNDPARYLRAVALWRLAGFFGLAVPDRSIGRDWSVRSLLELLRTLPHGATELYFHPVTSSAHKYSFDLPILLDERVRDALAGVSVSGMGELAMQKREVRQSRGLHSRDCA